MPPILLKLFILLLTFLSNVIFLLAGSFLFICTLPNHVDDQLIQLLYGHDKIFHNPITHFMLITLMQQRIKCQTSTLLQDILINNNNNNMTTIPLITNTSLIQITNDILSFIEIEQTKQPHEMIHEKNIPLLGCYSIGNLLLRCNNTTNQQLLRDSTTTKLKQIILVPLISNNNNNTRNISSSSITAYLKACGATHIIQQFTITTHPEGNFPVSIRDQAIETLGSLAYKDLSNETIFLQRIKAMDIVVEAFNKVLSTSTHNPQSMVKVAILYTQAIIHGFKHFIHPRKPLQSIIHAMKLYVSVQAGSSLIELGCSLLGFLAYSANMNNVMYGELRDDILQGDDITMLLVNVMNQNINRPSILIASMGSLWTIWATTTTTSTKTKTNTTTILSAMDTILNIIINVDIQQTPLSMYENGLGSLFMLSNNALRSTAHIHQVTYLRIGKEYLQFISNIEWERVWLNSRISTSAMCDYLLTLVIPTYNKNLQNGLIFIEKQQTVAILQQLDKIIQFYRGKNNQYQQNNNYNELIRKCSLVYEGLKVV
jgi:hypothetical protein